MIATLRCVYCGRFIPIHKLYDRRTIKWVLVKDNVWDSNAECYVPEEWYEPSHVKCFNKWAQEEK